MRGYKIFICTSNTHTDRQTDRQTDIHVPISNLKTLVSREDKRIYRFVIVSTYVFKII